MEISVESKISLKEDVQNYKHEWDFGEHNLNYMLKLHSSMRSHLKSESIVFDNGVLSKIPHCMKIFVSEDYNIYVYLLTMEGSTIRSEDDALEFDNCQIVGINMFCSFNAANESYHFKELKGIEARNKIQKHIHKRKFASSDFPESRIGTEYLFSGSYLEGVEVKTKYTKKQLLELKDLHLRKYMRKNRRNIYSVLIKFKISILFWNQDNTGKEAGIVSKIGLSKDFYTIVDKSNGPMITVKRYFLSSQFSDFIIKCGEKEFPVHKIILAGRSTVFEAMFQQPFKEMMEGRMVMDEDPQIVEEFLRYIYTEKVDNINANASGLLLIADKYDIRRLKRKCEKALVKAVTSQTFIELYKLAKLVNSKAIANSCVDHFKKLAKNIFEDPEDMKKFTDEYPELLGLSNDSKSPTMSKSYKKTEMQRNPKKKWKLERLTGQCSDSESDN